MSLEIKINTDIKQAMLARDSRRLEALRAVKAAILLEKTKGGNTEMTEADEIKMLQKLVKQRKESASIYSENGRPEKAEEENFQAEVIETYLPQMMSEDEIKTIVSQIVEQTGASSIKDMGRVMGMAVKQVAGRADNALVSSIVKSMLN